MNGTADIIIIVRVGTRTHVVPVWDPEPATMAEWENMGIEHGLSVDTDDFTVEIRVNNPDAIAAG